MGLQKTTLEYLDNFIIDKFGSHRNLNMIELGNQIIRNLNTTAKEYFFNLGVNHTSIDINNKDGAIPLNLCEIINDDKIQQCDILTNCGTTEHVRNQYICFKNIHNFVKKGGYFFHLVPPPIKNFIGHCSIYYTLNFFEDLALKNKYEIIENRLYPYTQTKKNLLLCIMQKEEENTFVPKNNWTPPIKMLF